MCVSFFCVFMSHFVQHGFSKEVTNGSTDDHSVVLVMNAPVMGIVPAAYKSFMLTYITNCLSDFPNNSLALLVFPNRAGQQEGRTDFFLKETLAQFLISNIYWYPRLSSSILCI